MKDKDKQSEFEKAWAAVIADIGAAAESASVGIQIKHVYEMLRANGEGFSEDQSLRIVAYGLFHQPKTDEE